MAVVMFDGAILYLAAGMLCYAINGEGPYALDRFATFLEFVWWVCFWPALLILKRLP